MSTPILQAGIEEALRSYDEADYRFDTWPPRASAPIVFGKDGSVISRFGDHRWDISEWSGKPNILNFGDGPQRKNYSTISQDNADLFRLLTAWFFLGPRAVRKGSTLRSKYKLIRPIFIHCSESGILASELHRYPIVIESLASKAPASRMDEMIATLHGIWEQREELGFFILDPRGLSRLTASAEVYLDRQTPYIPPRIWAYVLSRANEFIEDYNLNRMAIENCYAHCLQRYSEAAGSLQSAALRDFTDWVRPFGPDDDEGRFADVCERFGIRGLLEKWVCPECSTLSQWGLGLRGLSLYLGMVGYVGTLLIAGCSLVRIEEAWNLRSDCHSIHKDANFGDIHLITGRTTKTVQDDSAVWVTSQWCVDAIAAMSSVAALRMTAAAGYPSISDDKEFFENPYLVPRPYDPWTTRKWISADIPVRQSPASLAVVVKRYTRLFNEEELRITRSDLDVARRINPTLDEAKFGEGMIWTLAWHQLRRTGAVNMFASGVVSDASLQHQLKHATLLMTHYYAQGFSELALDEQTRTEIIRTMYEVASKDALELFNDDFQSPHGRSHKDQLLAPITGKQLKELQALAKTGTLAWRETPFGGCTKNGACEYGGFDSVVRCGGGDGRPPCAHGLYDNAKKDDVGEAAKQIRIQLLEEPDGGPRRSFLESTLHSFENILTVMSKREAP